MQLVPIALHEDPHAPLYASPDCQTLIQAYRDYYPTVGYNPPWIGYFVVDNGQVVGSCGFTGKPTHGTVELAYWTFKTNEGRGIASWCCAQLVEMAKIGDPTVMVTAKTAPELNASTHILTKNGFQFVGVVQDHEIGDAWLWKLQSIQV